MNGYLESFLSSQQASGVFDGYKNLFSAAGAVGVIYQF
jgi:hypothetical protein